MGEYVAGFGVIPACQEDLEWTMLIKASLPVDDEALKTLPAESNVQSVSL